MSSDVGETANYRRLQAVFVLATIMCMYLTPFVLTFGMLLLCLTPFFIVPLVSAAWVYHDYGVQERGGRPLIWMRDWTGFRLAADYFPTHIHKEVDLTPDHNYIIAWHPHGILGYASWVGWTTNAAGVNDVFPALQRRTATLNLNFVVPFMREFFLSMGLVCCSRKSLDFILGAERKGNAVLLCVGGAEEAIEAHPNTYKLCLKTRKGFAKVALRNGASIVPTFVFGENELYESIPNPRGSWWRIIQETQKRILGFIPVAIWKTGLLPKRTPLNVTYGPPLHVEMVENPTQEQIDRVHSQYLEVLTAFFERNKAKNGVAEDKHLEFY